MSSISTAPRLLPRIILADRLPRIILTDRELGTEALLLRQAISLM